MKERILQFLNKLFGKYCSVFLSDVQIELYDMLATEHIDTGFDDGVKVHYNKFGKGLKKITGLN